MLISLFNAVFRRGKSVLRRTWRPKISTMFMVGEATALAMRTNIKR